MILKNFKKWVKLLFIEHTYKIYPQQLLRNIIKKQNLKTKE